LAANDTPMVQALVAEQAPAQAAVSYDEASFRLALNEDVMASDKLAEGIRAFVKDTWTLQAMVEAKLA
jgi:transaldolase